MNLEELYTAFQRYSRALSNGIDIQAANEWMLSITERKECWELCIHILCKCDDDEATFFFASKLLHCIIRSKWETLNQGEQHMILEIILENIYGHNSHTLNNNTMNQLISCCAAIISRSCNLDALQIIGNRLLSLTVTHKTANSRTLSIFRELTIEIKNYDSITSGNIYSQFSKWIIQLRRPIVSFISNCFLEHQQSGYSEYYLDLISVALSMLSSWVNTEYTYNETSTYDKELLYQDHSWLTLRHLVTTSVAIASGVHEWTGLTSILNVLQILTKQFKSNSLHTNQIKISDLIINILQLLIDLLGAISSPKDDLLANFNLEQLQDNFPIVNGILQIFTVIINLWEEFIDDNISNITLKLLFLANNRQSMNEKKRILLEFQSQILCSPSSEDKNNVNKILYGLVELTSLFAEKHLSIFYGNSALYQSARNIFTTNLSNNNKHTNIGCILSSLLLLSAAIPDVTAVLCISEILIYAPEMFPAEDLQPFTVPIFEILTLQLMVPNDIAPRNFIQFSNPTASPYFDSYSNNNSNGSKVDQNYISFEEEEKIDNSLMFRREVAEILVSVWLKWPGGKSIPAALLHQLLTVLDSLDVVYANYQNTEEFNQIQTKIELPLEAMVFVFGRLMERLDNIGDDSLAMGTEEDSACNMASAKLPGFSAARSPLLASTSQDTDTDTCNGQILWFQVVGEITSYVTRKNGEVSEMLLVQFCDLWTNAAPSLRALYDSKGSVFSMTGSSRNTLSSDVVLSSAVSLCSKCLLINPEIASKSLREITVSLKVHLKSFAVDAVTNLLTILLRLQATRGANPTSRVVSERVYSSLGRLVSVVTPEESKAHLLHCSLTMCTSPVTKLAATIAQTPPECLASGLAEGWCEGAEEALSALRGLVLGLKEGAAMADVTTSLIHCLLDLLLALDYMLTLESQILSRKSALESLRLLDRASTVLCTLFELQVSVEVLQSTIARVKALAARHATPGLAALATVVVRLGSETPALLPELTVVVWAALTAAVGTVQQERGDGEEASCPHLDYILMMFRLLREVSTVAPQILIQRLDENYATTTVSSDSNDSKPVLHHAIHFIVTIIRNSAYLSNQKILRPLSAVMQSLLRIKLPGVYSLISSFSIEIIGPVLWGLLFGGLESMLTLSASLLWAMLEKPSSVTVEEHLSYLNRTLFTAFSQILTLLPQREFVITIASNHSQHLELAANDVIEVVALSLVNFCTSRSSLKMSLMACMQLTRGQLGNVNTCEAIAWLRWPDRIKLSAI